MSDLLTRVLNEPAWLVYLVVGLVVFAEDAFFAGFVVPGETAAILGGVSAGLGHTRLVWMFLVVCAAAIVGDSVGYEVGRTLGSRLFGHRSLARHARRVDAAHEFLRRRGGPAVFLGRWTAFFRAMLPALAGSARMPYAVFLRWNALGGIAWGVVVVLAGHMAGLGYRRVEHYLGTGAAVTVAVLLVIVVGSWQVRRERTPDADPPESV